MGTGPSKGEAEGRRGGDGGAAGGTGADVGPEEPRRRSSKARGVMPPGRARGLSPRRGTADGDSPEGTRSCASARDSRSATPPAGRTFDSEASLDCAQSQDSLGKRPGRRPDWAGFMNFVGSDLALPKQEAGAHRRAELAGAGLERPGSTPAGRHSPTLTAARVQSLSLTTRQQSVTCTRTQTSASIAWSARSSLSSLFHTPKGSLDLPNEQAPEDAPAEGHCFASNSNRAKAFLLGGRPLLRAGSVGVIKSGSLPQIGAEGLLAASARPGRAKSVGSRSPIASRDSGARGVRRNAAEILADIQRAEENGSLALSPPQNRSRAAKVLDRVPDRELSPMPPLSRITSAPNDSWEDSEGLASLRGASVVVDDLPRHHLYAAGGCFVSDAFMQLAEEFAELRVQSEVRPDRMLDLLLEMNGACEESMTTRTVDEMLQVSWSVGLMTVEEMDACRLEFLRRKARKLKVQCCSFDDIYDAQQREWI